MNKIISSVTSLLLDNSIYFVFRFVINYAYSVLTQKHFTNILHFTDFPAFKHFNLYTPM